ncbi:proteasome activator [Nonomuraea sp. NPDC001636]|uniref:proteasome activator n=1 Tax=Nonomuraea sp. NPDC001636 TaxID=3154391 RepID=UPI0033198F96
MTTTPHPASGDEQREHTLRDAVRTDIESVEEPARLLRVSAMARSLLEEAKGVHLEERARERMHRIYEQAIQEVAGAVAPELRDELERLRPTPNGGTPTEMEIRVMQGQLVGWLEGVFQGIQAGLQLQQAAARQQQLGLHAGRAALPRPDGVRAQGDGNYM